MTAVHTRTRSEERAGNLWRGPTREYDLVKELLAAFVVVALLTAALAALFSSPDEKPITLQSWAAAAPGDFVATATGELAGTTTSAGYGAPYTTTGDGQSMGPFAPQKWAGVRIPVDPAQDFVVGPVSHLTGDAAATAAVKQWNSATPDQQAAWAGAYSDALAKVDGDAAKVTPGEYGPVPVLATRLLTLAQSGGLDSALVSGGSGFYQTDYTRPLLFLGDSGYLDDQAGARHLHGDQWGMMNETGDSPVRPGSGCTPSGTRSRRSRPRGPTTPTWSSGD